MFIAGHRRVGLVCLVRFNWGVVFCIVVSCGGARD